MTEELNIMIRSHTNESLAQFRERIVYAAETFIISFLAMFVNLKTFQWLAVSKQINEESGTGIHIEIAAPLVTVIAEESFDYWLVLHEVTNRLTLWCSLALAPLSLTPPFG